MLSLYIKKSPRHLLSNRLVSFLMVTNATLTWDNSCFKTHIWLCCQLTCACRKRCIHCGRGLAGQLLPVCVTRPGHYRSTMTASSCRTHHWCNGLGWKINQVYLWSLKWEQVVMCHGMPKVGRNVVQQQGWRNHLKKSGGSRYDAEYLTALLTEDKSYQCKYQVRQYMTCQVIVHHWDQTSNWYKPLRNWSCAAQVLCGHQVWFFKWLWPTFFLQNGGCQTSLHKCSDIRFTDRDTNTHKRMLTRGGAAPNVTDDTDESERVVQVSALWITFVSRLL